MKNFHIIAAALGGLSAAFAAIPSAQALDRSRYDVQHAVAVCRATFSEDESKLFARPLALVNASNTVVPVTCSLQGDSNLAGRRIWQLVVNLGNEGAPTVGINCTLVDGVISGNDLDAQYTTLGTSVFGLSSSRIDYRAAEPGGVLVPIARPSLYCGLPPQGAINYIGLYYFENVGN